MFHTPRRYTIFQIPALIVQLHLFLAFVYFAETHNEAVFAVAFVAVLFETVLSLWQLGLLLVSYSCHRSISCKSCGTNQRMNSQSTLRAKNAMTQL